MIERTLTDIIYRTLQSKLTWLKIYRGKVIDVNDLEKKGRIQVAIFELGFADTSKGFWCPLDTMNGYISPKKGDWVKIYFEQGKPENPRIMGKCNEMLDMKPQQFDGNSTTQVLFEDNKQQIDIKFDELLNVLNIGGKTGYAAVSRVGDHTMSTSVDDSSFWIYLTALDTFIRLVSTALGIPFVVALPTSLTSKIIEGSNQVNIGNK